MTRLVKHEVRRGRRHSTLQVRRSKAGLHELWSGGWFAQAPRATGGARSVPPVSSAPSAQYLAMLRPCVVPVSSALPTYPAPRQPGPHTLSLPTVSHLPSHPTHRPPKPVPLGSASYPNCPLPYLPCSAPPPQRQHSGFSAWRSEELSTLTFNFSVSFIPSHLYLSVITSHWRVYNIYTLFSNFN